MTQSSGREDMGDAQELFEAFAQGRLDRRAFMRRSASMGIGVAAAAAIEALAAGPTQAQVADLALAARGSRRRPPQARLGAEWPAERRSSARRRASSSSVWKGLVR